MPPWFAGEYIPRQNTIGFESAREILIEKDDKMVVRRRFDRIYDMIEGNSHSQYEEVSENKEVFVC